ncbi:hypothetical protein D049_4701A, partial [Vibrio parahaemolyticus VPTS-2010]
MLILAWLD